MAKQRMTVEEIMEQLASETLLNQVRRKISSHAGAVEQATRQVNSLSPIALRRMEFEAAIEIAATLGIDLTPGAQPPTGVRGAIGPKGPTGAPKGPTGPSFREASKGKK